MMQDTGGKMQDHDARCRIMMQGAGCRMYDGWIIDPWLCSLRLKPLSHAKWKVRIAGNTAEPESLSEA